MKKTILTLFSFFAFLFFAKAQIQRGTYTMRPSVYLANSQTPYYSLAINYGYFITDDLLIKGGIGSNKNSQSYFDLGASLGVEYYYWKDSKAMPYIFGSTAFSRTTADFQSFNTTNSLRNGLRVIPGTLNNPSLIPSFIDSNRIIVTSTTISRTFNQLDASIGTGVQYFINENIAIDARMNFTALGITQKNTKKLYQQEYTLRLQPFYTASSYKAAKEINNFFYKGKTEIFGSMTFAPKTIGAIGSSTSFFTSFGGKYSLNKFFAAGASFSYGKIPKFYDRLSFGFAVESNIKLLKRLYLSPNIGFGFQRIDKNENLSSISTNLGFKFFMNKNVAWSVHFLSIPLYRSQKTLFPQEKIFFNNGFVYYLK